MHRVYVDNPLPESGGVLAIEGDEAAHALVKRVAIGEAIEVLDGRGSVGSGRVVAATPGRGKHPARLEVMLEGVRRVEPARPRVAVCSATPKGDRIDWMIEQLSQVGAASWAPLATARGVVDPRASKLDRLGRVAVSASKQCGRAHVLEIGETREIGSVLGGGGGLGVIVVADASGAPLDVGTDRTDAILLVGPEGGWSDEERRAFEAAGARLACFGPHVMRIETAAVVGAAHLLARSGASGSS